MLFSMRWDNRFTLPAESEGATLHDTRHFMSLDWFPVCNLQNNNISMITDETFCRGDTSYYIRTNMHQVRLDGNPIQLQKYPNSFICLQSLPVGWNH